MSPSNEYLLVLAISGGVIWLLHEIIVVLLVGFSDSYINIQEELNINREQVDKLKSAFGLQKIQRTFKTFKGHRDRARIQAAIKSGKKYMASEKTDDGDKDDQLMEIERSPLQNDDEEAVLSDRKVRFTEAKKSETKSESDDSRSANLPGPRNSTTAKPVPTEVKTEVLASEVAVASEVAGASTETPVGTIRDSGSHALNPDELETINLKKLQKWGIVKKEDKEKDKEKRKHKKKKSDHKDRPEEEGAKEKPLESDARASPEAQKHDEAPAAISVVISDKKEDGEPAAQASPEVGAEIEMEKVVSRGGVEVLGTMEVMQRIGKIKTLRLNEIREQININADTKAGKTMKSALLRSYVSHIKAVKALNVRQLTGRTSVNYVKALVQFFIAVYGADLAIFIFVFGRELSIDYLHRVRLIFSVYTALTVFEIYNKEQFQATFFMHHFSVIFSAALGISFSNEPLHPALFGYITCTNFLLGTFFALKGYKPDAKITRVMLGLAGYWYFISSTINLVGQAFLYYRRFKVAGIMRYLFPISYVLFLTDDVVLINYLLYQFKKNKIPPFHVFRAKAYAGGTAELMKQLETVAKEEEALIPRHDHKVKRRKAKS